MPPFPSFAMHRMRSTIRQVVVESWLACRVEAEAASHADSARSGWVCSYPLQCRYLLVIRRHIPVLTMHGQCDLSLPECSQCRRSRRPCPGPRTGAFFSSRIVRQGAGAQGTSLSSVSCPEAVPTSPNAQKRSCRQLLVDNKCNYGVASARTSEEVTDALHPGSNSRQCLQDCDYVRDISSHFRLSPSRQPSRADIFEQLFVSHFIELSVNIQHEVPCSPFWLVQLPGVLASPGTPTRASSQAVHPHSSDGVIVTVLNSKETTVNILKASWVL